MITWFSAGAVSLLSFETARAHEKIISGLAIRTPPEKMVDGPPVSVIIPTYNEERFLPGVIESVRNQTYNPIEIIVVDNLSEDSTVEIARQYDVTVLTNEIKGIPNISRNMGAAAAGGQYLVFVDADTVMQNDAIERMVIELENGADLVYPNKCSSDDQLYSTIRVAVGWLDPGGYSCSGACIATTREVIEKVGWNEELDPMYTKKEDAREMCSRAAHAGYKVQQLKTVYAATSDRRNRGQGFITGESLWTTRSIRNDATDIPIKGIF